MTLARALLPYTVRSARWAPVAAAAAAGLIFVLVMTLVPVTHDTAGLTNLLRIAALFGAVGAGFLLDDPSESSTAATPAPRPLRILLRPLVAVPAILLWWAAILLLLRRDTDDAETWRALPLATISLEAAALIAIAVAVAAFVVRRPPHNGGGTTAGPAVVVFVAVAQFVPYRYRLFATPDDQHWTTIHQWWAAILIAALLLLAWASRDLTSTRHPTPHAPKR